MKQFWKYRLRRRLLDKVKIVYDTGYTHEMWVYNLKIDREGNYSWRHYSDADRVIDLQVDRIIAIFVVEQKKVFYWHKKRPPIKRKPKIVVDQFKPPEPREAKPFGY